MRKGIGSLALWLENILKVEIVDRGTEETNYAKGGPAF
jgi:hypothetical protein